MAVCPHMLQATMHQMTACALYMHQLTACLLTLHSLMGSSQTRTCTLAFTAMTSSSACTCCLASPTCCLTGHGSIRSILDDMKLLSTEAEGVNDAIPDAFKTDHVNAAGRVGALLGLKPQGTGEQAAGIGRGSAASAHPQPDCNCILWACAIHMPAHRPSVLQICRSR